MATDTFLTLQNITKKFEDYHAVNEVSLSIPRGKIYGLLGPNGAGKTTLIRMITHILIPDSGNIEFDGEPLARKHTQRMGYMPEERGLYKKTKVIEQIAYLLQLKGLSEKDANQTGLQWLERLGLGDWAKKLTTDLSKGMQQKVQFIATVAHEPDLLILDEPVSGLDPVNAKAMEKEILRMKNEGKTIIFSTHRLEQVEELCDNLALIHRGKILIENSITNVRKQFQKNQYLLEYEGDRTVLENLTGCTVLPDKANRVILQMQENQGSREILRQLTELPIDVQKFELFLPRLNDIFIELVGGDISTFNKSEE
ncbi:MAG: ABC transporter ATP-binding protein [Bacteroidia bacterium]